MFQRTPSSVDVRANAPIDAGWFSTIATPGWQQRWLENFTANQAGGDAEGRSRQDGWTDLSRRIRARIGQLPREQRTLAKHAGGVRGLRLRKDGGNSQPGRRRCRRSRDGGRSSRPGIGQLCKRPCFHDEYLQAFNIPGTHLVDTDGKGVERITERGVVVAGQEYELECIIYASGFEVGTEYKRRSGFDLTGRDGVKLSDYWADGMRTKHGIHVHGFPNAFFVQPTQGANLISNVPHNLTEAAKTIAHTGQACAGRTASRKSK